jgi:hypothetical protein
MPAPAPLPEPDAPPPSDASPPRRWFNFSGEAGPAALDRQVTVSASALLLVGGGILALVVLVWAIGYSTGWSRGESMAVKDLGTGTTPAVAADPLKTEVPLNPNLLGTSPASKTAPGDLTGSIARAADPRQSGMNYLLLATLPRDDAEEVTSFVNSNGLTAFVVPVDPGARRPNNPADTWVFAAQGLTPAEYKARVPARQQTEDTARQLGARWKKEHRSSTDFSDCYWIKYQP